MQNSVKKMLRQMFRDKKRQKRIVAVICALSVLVATGVFNELMQPVITMTPDPVCGVAEHAHTSECYQNQLVCGIEESEEHAHGDGCFESVLACGKSEHEHGDSCYPEEIKDQPVVTAEPEVTAEPTEVPAVPATVSEEAPEVTAEPESTKAPEVTAAPETTEVPEVTAEPESTKAPEVTAEPEITAEPEVTAEPETTEVPEVTAEPEITAEPEVTAEPETTAEPDPTVEPAAPAITGATASAETAFVGQTVTWTFAAEGASELTYSIDDSEGNSVASGALDAGATCVSWLADRAGAFTLTVTAVNEFGSASITGAVTVEAAAELTAAVRGDSASAFAGESATFHFAVSGGVEPTAVSITVEQDGETLAALDAMTDSVTVESRHMGDKVTTLTATITAADSLGTTVSDSVQIPVAVRIHETESDWIKATETELTDDWRENLIAVAKTQLGYEESRLDFVIDEEGNAQGYTRYGQWWGASHDEWCAMFASFCLNYAEIPDNDFPREANCEKWIDALNSRGLYAAADEVQPEAGDLIFFDWENDGKCDHVGIVTDADTETIATIEGNSAASVRTREYEADDECIIGFGLLTKAFERHLADELDLDLETGVGAQALVLEDAILRAEPASDSMELAALTAETLVTVTAAEQNLDKVWYEVTTGDLTGYLPAATLQLNYIAIEDELIPVEADGNAGIMTLEAEEEITVTFAIDNSAYVNDSSSNSTHVRIESEELYQLYRANGMTTTTEAWDGQPGWYKVTGTGTVAAFTMDAGSSLSAAGLDTPDLEIYNLTGDTHANTYVSPYSWVTRDAEGNTTVCGASTVFNENTTLYLQLYTSGDIFYLDYVCCENCGKSISFATSSLYAHPSFKLGGCVSDEYIPKGTAVNSAFACDNSVCADTCRTASNGKVFAYWYLTDADGNPATDEEGNIIPFDSTFAITGDYLKSTEGNSVSVYAAWTDAPEMVTGISFQNADFTSLGSLDEVEYGTTIDALIEAGRITAPTLENAEFIGWTYGDGSVIVDGTHQITASDTIYRAVYNAKVFVKIPDVANGNPDTYTTSEYTVQTGSNLLTAVDADGNSISEIMEQETFVNGYLFNGWLVEQAGSSQAEEVTDLSSVTAYAVVTVTPNYKAALTVSFRYMPEGASEYVTIATYYVASGGSLNTAVDLDGNPVNGVLPNIPGYKVNAWQGDTNSNPPQYANFNSDCVYTAVSMTKLLTVTFKYNSQTASCEVPSGTTLAEALVLAGATPAASEIVTLEDGTQETRLFSGWSYVVVPEGATEGEYVAAANDMAITTDTEFTAVYQARTGYTVTFHDIGVDGKTELGDKTFEVLVPTGVVLADYLSEIVLHDDTSAADVLWYNATRDDESGAITKGEQFDVTEPLTANVDLYTFTYQITLQLSSATQTASLLDYLMPVANAEVSVVPNADGTTITITARDGDTLEAEDFVVNGVDYSLYTMANGTALSTYVGQTVSALVAAATPVTNADGTVSYTIEVTAPQLFTIKYDINHGQSLSGDTMLNSVIPTVGGALTATDTYNSASTAAYVVRTPSRTEYFSGEGHWSTGTQCHWVYEFVGWAVEGNENVLVSSNQELTCDELNQYAGNDGVLNLTAVWDAKNDDQNWRYYNGDYNDVNFFIARSVSFTGDGAGEIANWTDSLFATSTSDEMQYYEDTQPLGGADNITESGSNSPENLEADVQAAISGKLTYMPSDEYIFSKMREMQKESPVIKWPSGEYVAVSELNSTNFDIYWTVYKTDFWLMVWHIDGVLVPKKAKLIVEKEFYGDAESIAAVKNGEYSITVTDGSDSHKLTLSNADSDGNATDNSYTWTLTNLNRNTTYTVTESNYTVDSTGIANLAEYMVTNTNGTSTEIKSGKWFTYTSEGVAVKPISYQKEVSSSKYQTVTLLNSYLPTSSVAVWKVDAASGDGLAGATFKIEKLGEDGAWSDYTVYQDPATTTKKEFYMYDPYSDVSNRTATTTLSFDSTGNLTLIGLKEASRSGTYRLTEVIAPAGYSHIDTPIQFKLTVTGDGVQAFELVEEHANASIANGRVLRITNESTTTSVTVQKVWADGDTKEDVQLKLWLGDSAVYKESVVLNDTKGWTHTWTDLPLIVNGEPALYFVEEERIGSTYHSLEADGDDGYENYVVTKYPITYRFEDDGTTGNTSATKVIDGNTVYADEATLVVGNAVFKNDVRFLKTGNGIPLAGAGFTLYSDLGCTKPVKSAVSGTDGSVVLADINPGTYYMKETQVPAGYQENAMIYQVVVTFQSVTIHETTADADGNLTPATTAITTITNVPDVKVNLTLKKTEAGTGTALSGAKFVLQKHNGSTYANLGDEITTAANGTYSWSNLEEGQYQLMETKAPDGYYLSSAAIQFTIDASGAVAFPSGVTYDNASLTGTTPDVTITVTNTPGVELPSTGGPGKYIYTICGLFFMAASLLCGIGQRRKRERGEGI